ncbi:MAG TPA: rhomboid family intramembrane serine protease [Pyrinomonadaceae bacterium]|nr:rhomboid family intramembrane serine protease [Pyrinomonadaceae bacterium]
MGTQIDNAGRPTMCRSCGAIVGAGEPQCAVCGAPSSTQPAGNQSAQSQPLRPQDREAIRFARAILARPYKFTVILLVANLFVFLMMWESSGMTSHVFSLAGAFPESVLATYGAKLNYLIDQYRQWWRFVTPMFVHVNFPHLFINMFSLWMVGPYVEKLYGSAKFVVFWVFSGILSIVASYLTVRPDLATSGLGQFLFKTADNPSAGASGALFGLVGVLFVFGIKFRRELPEGFKRAFGVGMVPIIIINLFIGFLGRGFIDNAAHLGGLLTGMVLALAAEYRRPGDRTSVSVVWRVLQALSLVIVVGAFYKVVRNFNRAIPPSPQQIAKLRHDTFLNFAGGMNLLQEQLARVVHNNDVSQVETVSQGVMSMPAPDPRAAELRDQLIAIVAKSVEAANNQQKNESLTDEFNAWHEQYLDWFKGAH